jgi:hypothetical protein
MRSGMAEATRLTRAGRVLEATALIQRTLGVPSPLVTPVTTPSPADTVDAVYRVVEDPGPAGRQEAKPPGTGPTIPSAEAAPHRGRLVLPDGAATKRYPPETSALRRTGGYGPSTGPLRRLPRPRETKPARSSGERTPMPPAPARTSSMFLVAIAGRRSRFWSCSTAVPSPLTTSPSARG